MGIPSLAVRSTSPKRKPARPIESVELTVTFRTDWQTAKRIRAAFPSAHVRRGVCEVSILGERPSEVAEKTRVLLEKVRAIEGRS